MVQDVGLITLWPPEPNVMKDKVAPGSKTSTRNEAPKPVVDQDHMFRPTQNNAWIQNYTAYLEEDIVTEESVKVASGPRIEPDGPILQSPSLEPPAMIGQLPNWSPTQELFAAGHERNGSQDTNFQTNWNSTALNIYSDAVAFEEFSDYVLSGDQLWNDFTSGPEIDLFATLG